MITNTTHNNCKMPAAHDFCLLDSEKVADARRELQGFAQLPACKVLGASEAFTAAEAHPVKYSVAVLWLDQDESALRALTTTTRLRRALLAHQPFSTERLCAQADGTPFWQHCHAVPVADRNGGYVTFSVDVTQAHEYVGDYILGAAIGKGAHGSVRLGMHKDTGARVAIKCVEVNDQGEMAELVDNEIAVQQRLDSKYIARLLETVHQGGTAYLVMELVSQGSLYERVVRQGGVAEEPALDLFAQLVKAVRWCHQRGVCHRDLKPENIVVDGDGMLKLIDFGLSAFYVSGQKLHDVCGSMMFQAPEMTTASGGYDPEAVDVWAMGIVLFELMHGSIKPPARSSGISTAQHIRSRIAKLDDDEAATAILRRMLDPNPTTRICISEIVDQMQNMDIFVD